MGTSVWARSWGSSGLVRVAGGAGSLRAWEPAGRTSTPWNSSAWDRGDQSLLLLSDLDLAKALNLVVSARGECRPTVGGLLLLGRDEVLARLIPTHEVAWQVLDEGQRVRANDFFRWPLLRLVDEIMDRFRALNHETEAQVGMWRLPIPDYSEIGFREAVANAVIHRDYSKVGAVHVQWYPDRIEVSNPGGLVEGVRLNNLLVTPPRPRNPALADAFKRVGLVERTGRGIDRIFEGQLRLGRPAPDYGRTTESSVVVVLPGGPTSLAFARFVQECDRKGQPLCLDDLLILNELQQSRQIDVSRAREVTQKDEREARKALERLQEVGLIEGRGERRGRVYHLAARVYEALGQREAYVRAVGIEATRWAELIRGYVKRYGRITRSQAAELCGAGQAQVGRLLRRLVESGELERKGAGRGTYYVVRNPRPAEAGS
ncbi:MAG: winged helix DNA-binding domain-containing protein [Acetobacteraceae bacterium]|nr:winged helix DNA-binding domain-containing protein [Acetobacteraceae bacterium]